MLHFLAGIGNAFAYAPSLSMVNEYFHKRKATALGLSTAGTGLGSFCLPLLSQLLIDYYGYFGCMLVLSAISLNLVVCGVLMRPLSISESSLLEKEHEEIENSLLSKVKCFMKDVWAKFDFALLGCPTFIIFAIAGSGITMGFKSVAVILPHHAQLAGILPTRSVLLVSLAGLCDTVSRFSMGLLFDWPRVKPIRRHLWTGAMFLLAVNIFVFVLSKNYPVLIIVSMLFGLSSGMYVSQLLCILSDLIGQQRFASALGLLILFRGLGSSLGPPLAGALRDITIDGSYTYSFIALSSGVFAGFCLLLLLNVIIGRDPQLQQTQQEVTTIVIDEVTDKDGDNIQLECTNSDRA